MQNFNAQAQGQPTYQRDSFLFIEFLSSIDESEIVCEKIDPDNVRDNGIGAVVAYHVQRLVKMGYDVKNVYIGTLL